MKNKYHEDFLKTARRLDEITDNKGDNIYKCAVKISESLEPLSIKELCETIHKISVESNKEDVKDACKKLYMRLTIIVGIERVREIVTNIQEKETDTRSLDDLLLELNQLVGLQKVKQTIALLQRCEVNSHTTNHYFLCFGNKIICFDILPTFA